MNKLCLLGAAALIATAFLPDVASAQRGGGTHAIEVDYAPVTEGLDGKLECDAQETRGL